MPQMMKSQISSMRWRRESSAVDDMPMAGEWWRWWWWDYYMVGLLRCWREQNTLLKRYTW